MYNGGDISSNFEKVAYYSQEKENGVYVVLTGIVPEPAAVAAIFGAVALAYAARRRRIR